MAYMTILEHTDGSLKLIRKPSQLSQIILVGLLVGVFGVINFGTDSFLYKALIGLVAVAFSTFMMESYEICEIDREEGEARLSRLHWSQYLVGLVWKKDLQPHALLKFSDIASVDVTPQDADKYAHQVVLTMHSGVHLGITEAFTDERKEEHEAIAKVITDFLKATPQTGKGDVVRNVAKVDDDNVLSSDDDDDSHDDGEDSEFENISKADIEGFQEEDETLQRGWEEGRRGEEEEDKKDEEVKSSQ